MKRAQTSSSVGEHKHIGTGRTTTFVQNVLPKTNMLWAIFGHMPTVKLTLLSAHVHAALDDSEHLEPKHLEPQSLSA